MHRQLILIGKFGEYGRKLVGVESERANPISVVRRIMARSAVEVSRLLYTT